MLCVCGTVKLKEKLGRITKNGQEREGGCGVRASRNAATQKRATKAKAATATHLSDAYLEVEREKSYVVSNATYVISNVPLSVLRVSCLLQLPSPPLLVVPARSSAPTYTLYLELTFVSDLASYFLLYLYVCVYYYL